MVYQGAGEYIKVLSQRHANLPIIFSTWTSGESSQPDHFSPNHWLVKSPRPHLRGPSNLNMQKQSTLAGLRYAQGLGFEYALKVRDDMDIDYLDEIINMLDFIANSNLRTKIWFFDWVLHLSGYPMDFIQFGRTQDLISLWESVNVGSINVGVPHLWPEFSCPEIRLKSAFIREFSPDPFKKIGFLANDFMADSRIDIHWLKRSLSMRRDWAGNPQFVQLSAFRE